MEAAQAELELLTEDNAATRAKAARAEAQASSDQGETVAVLQAEIRTLRGRLAAEAEVRVLRRQAESAGPQRMPAPQTEVEQAPGVRSTTVRAARGCLSALSVFHSKSVLYGVFCMGEHDA